MICGNSIDNLFDISNFIIIQGSGGIGKSTFLKYLFVQEVSKKRLIPVFIELKDLNSMNEDYEICDFIFQRLYDLGSTIKKEYMDYALQSGCFVFLLDGYDEVSTLKRDTFFENLIGFAIATLIITLLFHRGRIANLWNFKDSQFYVSAI